MKSMWRVVMAESIKTSSYRALPAASDADDERWPLPQTAMFVTLTSVALWALIAAAARWLIG
jgi:hypothetical protein